MSEIKSLFKPKRLVIKTISRGAPITAKNKQGQTTTRPGNLRINDMWFSSVEWRNQLLGAELPLELPVSAFIGCTISYDELTITEELLKENGGKWTEIIRGQEVSFTKPGVNHNNLTIDFSTLHVTENLVNMMKIKKDFPSLRADQGASRATQPARPTQPVEIDEIVDDPADDGIDHSAGHDQNDQPAQEGAETKHVDIDETAAP